MAFTCGFNDFRYISLPFYICANGLRFIFPHITRRCTYNSTHSAECSQCICPMLCIGTHSLNDKTYPQTSSIKLPIRQITSRREPVRVLSLFHLPTSSSHNCIIVASVIPPRSHSSRHRSWGGRPLRSLHSGLPQQHPSPLQPRRIRCMRHQGMEFRPVWYKPQPAQE